MNDYSRFNAFRPRRNELRAGHGADRAAPRNWGGSFINGLFMEERGPYMGGEPSPPSTRRHGSAGRPPACSIGRIEKEARRLQDVLFREAELLHVDVAGG